MAKGIEAIVVTTNESWKKMLDRWIKKHDYLHFTDHSEAIEYIVRDYISQNQMPKFVRLVD